MSTHDWQPATSAPGEIHTPEGKARAAGSFARNLRDRDPRGEAYRRGMRRAGLAFVGIGLLIVVASTLLSALFT